MPKKKQTMVIGIDPGLRATGYAVLGLNGSGLEGLELAEYGEIKPSPRMTMEDRLGKLFDELESVLERWHPDLMAVEKVYSETLFPNTAIILGHVRGVIYLAAHRADISLVEIPSTVAKKALTGFGRASKAQMGNAITRLLKLKEIPDSEHIADALSLATVGALRSAISKGNILR